MHIVFFTETYFPQINGVTYTIDAWRKELQDRGHEVTVVYPKTSHDPDAFEFPVKSIDFRPVDGYQIGLARPGTLTAELADADLIHTHGQFSMGVLAARTARKLDVPFVMSYHTPCEQYFDYVSQNERVQDLMDVLYLRWERWMAKRCDRILSPSSEAKKHLEGRIRKQVIELSNGINTAFFKPQDPARCEAFRDEHGIGDGPVIGYCGRLGYEKRLEDLIALADRFDGEIVIAGEGFAQEHYLPKFEEAGINYLGRLKREEMPVFYSVLDTFVIPSTAETQGVSVLEANACGAPAIGADAAALKDTITPSVNGQRYPPGDIDALEDGLETVLSDITLPEQAQESAQRHSVEAVIDRLLDIYADCRPDQQLQPV